MRGLTSIVVPCHENLLYTALCLQSIGRHTPGPHEVIVVDNGCSDGTGEWCAAAGARVVRSSVNLGFAGGCNLGLAAAAACDGGVSFGASPSSGVRRGRVRGSAREDESQLRQLVESRI